MNIELKPDVRGYMHFDNPPIGGLFLSHGINGTMEVKVIDSVLGDSHTAWIFVDPDELRRAVEALLP